MFDYQYRKNGGVTFCNIICNILQDENENLAKKTFILRFFENRLLFTKKKCIA